MEVISIERSTYEELLTSFNSFVSQMKAMAGRGTDKRLGEWLDNQNVCQILNISPSTQKEPSLLCTEFNDDKADKTLLKRIPYYGIGISLPFILMRHWDEWQESRTLTMDDMDRRLCRLVMEIQYKCQQFFFGEMAFNYFADQNKEFVVRKRSNRYIECFRKLPEEFTTPQFMDCFKCSQPTASRSILRLLNDGVVERLAHGKYKKTVSELP